MVDPDAWWQEHRFAHARGEFPLGLDPTPFRNRFDGSRWADDGGDPDLLPLVPRVGYEQDPAKYTEAGEEGRS